jgi:hypothetical protein
VDRVREADLVSELAIRDSIERTETALVLPDGLPEAAWRSIGEELGRFNRASAWWVGDWINYAETKWGDKYAEAQEITDLTYQHLSRCASVARTFQFMDRSINLTWSHYNRARSLPNAGEILQRAEAEGWSVRDMQRHAASQPSPRVAEITSGRDRTRAEAHKRRVYTVLSGVEGYCMGLAEIDLARAIAVATAEDLKAWTQLSDKAGRALKGLNQTLKEARL